MKKISLLTIFLFILVYLSGIVLFKYQSNNQVLAGGTKTDLEWKSEDYWSGVCKPKVVDTCGKDAGTEEGYSQYTCKAKNGRDDKCTLGEVSAKTTISRDCNITCKVNICHSTGSATNTYVSITVDDNSIIGGKDCDLKGHGSDPDDIIPAFTTNDKDACVYSGQHLERESWIVNDCKDPKPTVICGDNKIEAGEQCDDGNVNDKDGCSSTCQIETPVCTDKIATNYDSDVSETEYSNNRVCLYSTHRWCKEVCNDKINFLERRVCENISYEAIVVADNEINPPGKPWETGMDKWCEISEEPTPTPISDNGDICPNLDGIQTELPFDFHFDAGHVNCVQFTVPGVPESTGGTEAVLGASTTSGKVLGASSMAGTGVAESSIFYSIFSLGSLLTSLGIMKNGKKKS